MKSPVQSKSGPAPGRVLDATPVRLFDAPAEPVATGQWRLTVPLKPARWMNFLVRRPAHATKTFELDEIGKAVWDACDGDTPVRAIITTLASRYDLNVREVEVATVAFLKTLVQKGLVGIPVEDAG